MPRRTRSVILLITLLACLLAHPVTAQQGHNPPAGDDATATPDTAAATTTGWQVAEVTPLEIEGTALALSPDGAWLAGVAGPAVFCVWRVEDLAESCEEVAEPIEINSLSWAPDSSAVAFSTDAFRLFIDSDIMVYELSAMALHNATDDGFTDNLPLGSDGADEVPIDVMPAWTPDSQELVFSRAMWPAADVAESTVARIARDGGEVTTLTAHRGVPFGIFTPMRVLADGTVIYAVAAPGPDEPANGIWQVTADGESTQLIAATRDGIPGAILTDAWQGNGELRITGFSPLLAGQFDASQPPSFTWSSTTEAIEPIQSKDEGPGRRAFIATLSPDGGTVLTVLTGAEGAAIELTGPAHSITELPGGDDPDSGGPRPYYLAPDWANDTTVLVQPGANATAYLLTLEPASASD